MIYLGECQAIDHAEKIVLEWLNSITIGFNKPNSEPNKIKQEQKLLEE
jgi:hypothetical protein